MANILSKAVLWILTFKISLILKVRVKIVSFHSVLREKSILFSVNCEKTFLPFVKSD